MGVFKCGMMGSGCEKSRNTFHKCKKTIKLSESQEQKINMGGRIDGPVRTSYCKGHVCEHCNKKFVAK